MRAVADRSTPLSTVVERTSEGRPVPQLNLLTIDVEDYFHASGLGVEATEWAQLPGRVEYTTRRLVNILGEHDVRATFFVLGWVADRYPQLVRLIHEAGHEIASHGWSHRLVYTMSRDEFRRDVRASKDLLEQLIGERVVGYRAPSFTIVDETAWALEILALAGYRYDSSIFPVRRSRYGSPEAPRFIHQILRPGAGHDGLIEVPPSTVRWRGRNLPVAGGGYFRAYPLWMTRRAIEHINRVEQQPAVVYLHPWEIDPDQPRRPATAANRFRHYLNLHRTEDRLLSLLRQMPFGTIRDVLGISAEEPALGSERSADSTASASAG